MSYNELYHQYKKEMILPAFFYSIKPIQNRLLIALAIGVAWIVLLLLTFDFITVRLLLAVLIIVAGWVSLKIYLNYADKKNRAALLKQFDYNFTDIEKEATTLLIERIQQEKLIAALKDKAGNKDYITSLIERSEEYTQQTKLEFSIKGLGVVALIVILINNFVGSLYKYWETQKTDIFDIFEYTLKGIGLLLVFSGAIYVIQQLLTAELNTNYYRHKDLKQLLKNLRLKLEYQ